MARPSSLKMLMDVAEVISRRSTCNRLHVGALIVSEGRILSTGYNGPPAGMMHCDHTDDTPCEDAVHAEANAIVFAAKYGVSTQLTELYSTHEPCLKCSQLIVNAGIAAVHYLYPYRDHAGIQLLEDAGVSAWKVVDE